MAPRRTKHYEITRPLPRDSMSLRRCAETPKRRNMGMALHWHDPGVPKILDLGSRRVERIGQYDGFGNLEVPSRADWVAQLPQQRNSTLATIACALQRCCSSSKQEPKVRSSRKSGVRKSN